MIVRMTLSKQGLLQDPGSQMSEEILDGVSTKARQFL